MNKTRTTIAVSLIILLTTAALNAQKILVINTYNPTYPWTAYFNLGLRQKAEQSGGKIELFFEDLDVTRFGSDKNKENFALYLTNKYTNYPLDAVIGNSDEACSFIEQHCNFTSYMPKAYYTSIMNYPSPSILALDNMYTSVVTETWNIMQTLFPEVKRIKIIMGDEATSEAIYNDIKAIAGSQVTISAIDDFSFESLKDIVSKEQKDTAFFFTPVTVDKNGLQVIPKQLLTELSAISPCPIFTFWDTLLGSGCVGGQVLSAQRTSQEMLKGIQDYLQTGKFASSYKISIPFFDWQALKKYGLHIETLSEDALLLNKPQPFYIVHAKAILLISNIVLAALFLIILSGLILLIKSYHKLKFTNVELATAREQAESLSLHDTLTGLYNRRAIEPMITYELNRKKRFGSSVSLLILDIDHFKKVNDTYGHDKGDEVLKKIAHTMHDYRRSTDLPSRWGGEEFLILLADTDEGQAILIAEKIRKACSSLVFENCSSITVSIGIAEAHYDETFDSWFKRADSALYEAKNTGRNKTVASSGMDPETAQKQTGHELLLLHLSWKDDFRIGVEVYDKQHKQLFSVSNKLISAIVNNEKDDIIFQVLDELYTETENHFTDEQNYLEKRNCKFIERHKKEHKFLLEQLNKKTNEFEAKKISAYEFVSFICSELISKHILGEDKLSFENIHR